jgi:phosphatidate cytidylyltransferase
MNRALTAAIGVPVILTATYWAPNWLFATLLALVAGVALDEFFRLKALSGSDTPGRWFLPFGAVVTLAFIGEPESVVGAFLLAMGAIAAASLAAGAASLRRRITTAAWGIFYTCLLLGFLIWLPRSAIFVLLGIIWIGDAAAFYVGRALGQHYLAPHISPNKTIEGSIAGILGSLVIGVFVGRALLQLPIVSLIVLSLLTSIAGQLGDLAESAVKRRAGVKDSGRLLPGHGGILDRIDSLLAASPVFFLVTRLT